MWEQITVAVCGLGFALGTAAMALGVLGTVDPRHAWLPPLFR